MTAKEWKRMAIELVRTLPRWKLQFIRTGRKPGGCLIQRIGAYPYRARARRDRNAPLVSVGTLNDRYVMGKISARTLIRKLNGLPE